jgi:hypothetical protein
MNPTLMEYHWGLEGNKITSKKMHGSIELFDKRKKIKNWRKKNLF